jgi:hypothetical protein
MCPQGDFDVREKDLKKYEILFEKK